jgi:magnesium transporter
MKTIPKTPHTLNVLKNATKTTILNRKKGDPGKFVFTGKTPNTGMDIQLFKYNKQECIEQKHIAPDSIGTFHNPSHQFWLNVYGLNEPEITASICMNHDIHDLVIQDILDVNQRPKFQEFENHAFLTLKSIVPSDTEMITEQISFVFGKNFLMSFQERKADFFEHLRFRLREDKGIIRERGADYLLFAMLESILDNYFKTLDQLDHDANDFNFSDVKKEVSPDALIVIEDHKKFVHYIKKSILPIKEFTLMVERGENAFIEKRHLKYFLEIKDLCLTLLDSCDMILASLESYTNLFFSIQGHRMNQVMKTLTIVATIFIPLTFIAGIYGMNFTHMPELHWKYGYAAVWLLFILSTSIMILYLKKKKWL